MGRNVKKLRKLQMDKVCRACLTDKGHLKDIINTKIPLMLEFCTSIQVKEEDDLPKQICITCFHQISNLYTFKRKVEINDKFLHKYIRNHQQPARKEYTDVLCEAVNEAKIEILYEEEVEEEQVVDDSEFTDYIKIDTIERAGENSIIITGGPPPLIPFDSNKTAMIEPVRLPENTPPLVPLKPTPVPAEIEKIIKLECSVCGDEFNSVSGLRHHRKFKCQSTGLQCNICRKDFKDRKKLIGHLKGHMVAKDYICKMCGKCYPNPSTFKVHMRTHTGERPFKCQVCNKGFVRWAGVVGHMKTHNSQKPYKCETCGKSFKIASNLERHKILHTGSFPFCCNFCGKTFSQADNLQLHIRTYHTFEKPFLCNECGKGFVSSTRLNRHMWVHSGYKPYRCKICDKAYSNSNDLKNHMRIHCGGPSDNDKPHVCNVCGMRFFHACRLLKHLKIHEKKTSQPSKKTFSSNFLLNKHIEEKHHQVGLEDLVVLIDVKEDEF